MTTNSRRKDLQQRISNLAEDPVLICLAFNATFTTNTHDWNVNALEQVTPTQGKAVTVFGESLNWSRNRNAD